MNGQAVDIATPDGTMDGYAAWPDGGIKFPLVVMFMDIWGLREELFGLARKVAAEGYYCVVPNLFYRTGKVRFAQRNTAGKLVSFEVLPAAQQTEMLQLSRGLDRAMVRSDVAALLDFCGSQPVDPGPAGVIGFCLGGRIAFLAAQEFPVRFRVTASLHGVFLATDADDSPHRYADRMRGEVYGGHGDQDRFSAPEVRAALEQAFAGRTDVSYRSNVHIGAHHGYSLPDRDIHDAAATAIDWREIFAMLERQLKRPTPAASPAGSR